MIRLSAIWCHERLTLMSGVVDIHKQMTNKLYYSETSLVHSSINLVSLFFDTPRFINSPH